MPATASTYAVKRSGYSVLRTIGEVEEPATLDRLTDHRGGRRRPHRERRMRDDVLVGQRLHPATKRPRAAAPDQRQVILDQEVGDELVVTRRRSMLDRLDGEPARPEPPGGAPMDLTNGSRVVRGELEAGELREERMDAIPTAVLEPDHEEVRALELVQSRAESPRPNTSSASSAVKRPRTATRSRNERATSGSEPITSWLR